MFSFTQVYLNINWYSCMHPHLHITHTSRFQLEPSSKKKIFRRFTCKKISNPRPSPYVSFYTVHLPLGKINGVVQKRRKWRKSLLSKIPREQCTAHHAVHMIRVRVYGGICKPFFFCTGHNVMAHAFVKSNVKKEGEKDLWRYFA